MAPPGWLEPERLWVGRFDSVVEEEGEEVEVGSLEESGCCPTTSTRVAGWRCVRPSFRGMMVKGMGKNEIRDREGGLGEKGRR